MELDTTQSTIEETELGKSVLTLTEVLQTFAVESAMYNIKRTTETCRTVILTRNKVEIDGKDKTLIMIRDVTDKVRLQLEQIKKIKQKERTFKVQSNLDDVFK